MKRLLAGLTVAFASIATLGCPNNPPTPVITTLNPTVRTLAIRQGLVDNNNNCSVATPPSPPAPDVWFNSLPVTAPEKAVSQGVVGFNVWRNTFDGCLESRQDLYRTRFSYDLTGVSNLKGLVTGAALDISVVIMPVAPSGIFCQAFSGGGGSLFRLPNNTTLPPSQFTLLAPPAQFSTTGRIFGMTNPWIAGTIQPGVTTQATGLGGASWTVDLTSQVDGAIQQGLPAIFFEISGSDETRITTAPAGSTDCRTVFRVGPLSIKHL
jgi:hypothetical protein